MLLIDISDEIFKKMKSEGSNISKGSFGSPYNVELNSGYSNVIGNENLPVISEQDIVIIDLLGAEVKNQPGVGNEIPKDMNDLYCSHRKGWIDPRPKNMDKYRIKFDRILKYGGFFVVFSEPRYRYDFFYGTIDDYGEVHGEEVIIDNWSFLSILDKNHLEIKDDEGEEIQNFSDLLSKNFVNNGYTSVFSPEYSIENNFYCLLKNRFNDCVACLLVYKGVEFNGHILILPSITVTYEIIKELLNEIIPSIAPHMFPNIEGKWIEGLEYELNSVTKYKQQIKEIILESDKKINSIKQKIDNEKNQFDFLHNILTKTGDELVNNIEKCLRFIGFNDLVNLDDELNKDELKEEDLRICDDYLSILLEVKGPSTLTKDEYIMQLVKYISRRRKEWNRFNVNGILIINHQRNIPPIKRDNNEVFKEQQIKDANFHDIGLMTTWNLFILIKGMIDYNWDPKVVRDLFYEKGKISDVPSNYKVIGKIFTYISNKNIIGIDITGRKLYKGQTIGYLLDNKFLEEKITSLQIENDEVEEANKGSKAGIKTVYDKSELKVGLTVYHVDK